MNRPHRSPLRHRIPALALAALAAGCAVGPDFHAEPPAAPKAFANAPASATPAASVDHWWTAFNDPLLDELIGQVSQENLKLAEAEARLRQARAQARAIGGNDYPSLSADANAIRSRTSENGQIPIGKIPGATITFTNFAAGFDARWEIDLFGHQRRTVEAANAKSDVQIAEARGTLLSVTAEVAADYFDYRGVQARLAVLDDSIADATHSLDLVRQRRDAGDAADVEVARAQGELLGLQSQRPNLVSALGVDEYQLELLLGEAPGALSARLAAPAALPGETPPPSGLPSQVLQRRPDVAEAQAQLHLATANVGIAVADEFPRFSLIGSFGNQAIHSGDFLDAASRYWSLGPTLTLPLFEGGALKNQVQAQKAARDAAVADYRQAVLAALADTEAAFLRDVQVRQLASQREQQLRAAQTILDTQQQRYAAGDIPLTDLLDAQRQRNDARSAQIDARVQVCRDRIALFKALGGGWGERAVDAQSDFPEHTAQPQISQK